MINENPKYLDMAQDYGLWCEYFDTGATIDEEEFDALPTEFKIKLMELSFGPESDEVEE